MIKNSLSQCKSFKRDEIEDCIKTPELFAEFLAKEWSELLQRVINEIDVEKIKSIFPNKCVDGISIEEYLGKLHSADGLFLEIYPNFGNRPIFQVPVAF